MSRAGLDPYDWPDSRSVLGRLSVPENDGTLRPLRPMHAALSSGYDPERYQDPVRGEVDLLAQLRAHIAATVEDEVNDATFSFQLLALHAAGVPDDDPDVQLARQRLLAAQRDDGAWGCAANWGIECTGFAVAALAASGGVPAPAGSAGLQYVQGLMEGDGWGTDPQRGGAVNTQETAWGITTLRLLGLPPADATWAALLANQDVSGGFLHGNQTSLWATAEVATVLAGGLPGPSWAPAQAVVWDGYARADDGFVSYTWHIDGAMFVGQSVLVDLEPGTYIAHLHATGPGIHHRSLHVMTIAGDNLQPGVSFYLLAVMLLGGAGILRAIHIRYKQ